MHKQSFADGIANTTTIVPATTAVVAAAQNHGDSQIEVGVDRSTVSSSE